VAVLNHTIGDCHQHSENLQPQRIHSGGGNYNSMMQHDGVHACSINKEVRNCNITRPFAIHVSDTAVHHHILDFHKEYEITNTGGYLPPQTSPPSSSNPILHTSSSRKAQESLVHYKPMPQQDTVHASSITKEMLSYDTSRPLTVMGKTDLENVYKPCTVSEQSEDYLDDESVASVDTLCSSQGKMIKRKEIKQAAANALLLMRNRVN